MSPAPTAGAWELETNDPSVREWLDRVAAPEATESSAADDPLIAEICAAAVDPLEIAAALEAAGMSKQVVNDAYRHPDVFALARHLWVQVPFHAAKTVPAPLPRPGSWRDLGRGALYAAPAVILFALTRALGLELAWWTLPVALTWGWALGQVTAYTGYTLRGRGNAAGEAETSGWLLVVAAGSTVDIAAIAAIALGGGLSSIVAAAGVTTYMVAAAILLLHDEERLAALLLAPAAGAAALMLLLGSSEITDALVIEAVLGSAIATLICAARHATLSWRSEFGLGTADLRISLAHLVHGLLCGLALSLVAIEGARSHAGGVAPHVVALPLLLTLGVMEWQLRTFKASVGQLMRGQYALEEFKPMAWLVFQRSFGIYIAMSVMVSAVLAVVVHVADGTPPYGLLAAQVALGATYFLDLTIVSVGRLDLVLTCWLTGAAAGLAYAVWAGIETSMPGDVLAWRAGCVAVVAALGALFLAARRVAAAAISH